VECFIVFLANDEIISKHHQMKWAFSDKNMGSTFHYWKKRDSEKWNNYRSPNRQKFRHL